MTIIYSLAPVPKWYIANLVGLPLAGGYLATFSSLDNSVLKPVFQDNGGNFVWPYVTIPNVGKLGILFDENGSQGPFYFEFDSLDPDNNYYLEVYDSDGNLQWTINDFFSPNISGGGGNITTTISLENLVINNVYYRNLGETPVGTSTFLNLCPGANAGLAATSSNAGPDINFIKNNINATDEISFPKFPPGTTPLTGDVSPVDYMKYQCTNTPVGETYKYVQIPMSQGVRNLSNTQVTVYIWARANGGANTLILQWYQFFGDGAGASPAVTTPIDSYTLSNSWQKFATTVTIPNITGKVIGDCGNDGLFLQIQFPLGMVCNIDHTKPSVFLGSIAPTSSYQSYDMIDGVINSDRTGNIKVGFNSTALPGYVRMDDGSIGNPSSLATTRANTDTFPLYNLLWNNVSDTWAPVSGGRGSSAIADFTANKTLTLTRSLGRAMAAAGTGADLTARALGEYLGEENHLLTISEMPSHNHPGSNIPSPSGSRTCASGSGVSAISDASGAHAVSVASQGGSTPHNIMQPTSFMNFFIKL
jgi:hypothetical protein